MEAAFAIGDKAVYPVHGVTEVVGLEHRDVGGHPLTVYILKVLENSSTIVVPTGKAQAVGLRQIISPDEVEEVLAVLRCKDVDRNDQTWNRRQREYMDKLKTGSVFEIAEVFRDLTLLGLDKQLSFSERRLLDTAKSLLVQELALARGTPQAEMAHEINSIFANAVAA
jgi:CarD family transcriptional regulator